MSGGVKQKWFVNLVVDFGWCGQQPIRKKTGISTYESQYLGNKCKNLPTFLIKMSKKYRQFLVIPFLKISHDFIGAVSVTNVDTASR